MPRTLSIPQTLFTPGTYQQEIDKLQPQSVGFELRITRDDPQGLESLSGKCADLLVEISTDDGAHYVPWIPTELDGGPMTDKFGQPINTAIVSATWPGENDGSGGRRELKQTNVRLTMTVVQAFRASGSLIWI